MLRTLGDLTAAGPPTLDVRGGAAGGPHAGHDHDEPEGGEEAESWFAGGERRQVIYWWILTLRCTWN
jgi:hypothetical protein